MRIIPDSTNWRTGDQAYKRSLQQKRYRERQKKRKEEALFNLGLAYDPFDKRVKPIKIKAIRIPEEKIK